MGIQTWSPEGAFNCYTIFAVEGPLQFAQANSFMLANNIGFKPLIGSYKGVTEQSFIINSIDDFATEHLWERQESLLRLSKLYHDGTMHGRRRAVLDMLDDRTFIDLGLFRDVHRDVALASEGWTYDPQENRYWVASF